MALVDREFIPFFRNYESLQLPAVIAAVPFIFHRSQTLKADRLIGELSYPLYMFHWGAVELSKFFLGVLSVWWTQCAALPMSVVTVVWIESPLGRRRTARRSSISLETKYMTEVHQKNIPIALGTHGRLVARSDAGNGSAVLAGA